ncbi:hypothetical protein TG4357_02774 [Thalassovita gelatinovora]|uniref:Uncharacterized protein n=1 Tax=Thalassovita gelatinovora TaxID=53501 RepID=A0A0P1FFY2_THAGE|nr:hypothetical protein [Thalassovita gelatinovora]QIZ79891.1 hypothetical protein HFZ77_05035 [Thalassovita gelatinovora]CUH67005.1 hypothetical protein TG4357_02774 [Thalassovita gelatinovora]SEQ46842.1 hypothetical protein SAMN04488043_105312 [Thalassovita gelatinovora]
MTEQKFLELIEKLEAEVEEVSEAKRAEIKVRLQSVIEQMQAEGVHVPQRVRLLEERLTDEVVESMFDNMPV